VSVCPQTGPLDWASHALAAGNTTWRRSMIDVDLNEAGGVAIVHLEQTHGLSAEDFKQLTDRVDHYLEDHDLFEAW
jgi:hypothetical protein